MTHLLTLTTCNSRSGVQFQVAYAKFPDRPLQVGKGVCGNLHVRPYADKGHFPGRGMMDRLTIKGTADTGTEVPDPFWQVPGNIRVNPVGFSGVFRCG